MPHELAQALAVEVGAEELAVRSLEPGEVKLEPARALAAHLHGGEMTEPRCRCRQLAGFRNPTLDLDVHRPMVTEEPQV